MSEFDRKLKKPFSNWLFPPLRLTMKGPLILNFFFSHGRGGLFFVDFSVIKARELHETRCKTFPFESLADGGLKTNHSDSEPGGPRI